MSSLITFENMEFGKLTVCLLYTSRCVQETEGTLTENVRVSFLLNKHDTEKILNLLYDVTV